MNGIIFVSLILTSVCINGNPINKDIDLKSERSPEEWGDHFQGDLELSEQQISNLKRGAKTGIIDARYKWIKGSNGKVVIPYIINANSGYTSYDNDLLLLSMREIENNTCVVYVPRTSQVDYIEIYSGDGCSSSVGRQGGRQTVSLMTSLGGATCMEKGIIMHELIHAIGFYHMQSHTDRDKFVTIIYENVKSGYSINFNTYPSTVINNYNTPYDMDSIMHYLRNAFSKSSSINTIEPVDRTYLTRIGQRVRLSPGDIARIKNMFVC